MTPQQLADACARAMWDGDRAVHRLGITRERVAPGTAVLSLEVSPDMANGHGIAHGGVIFTLADSAFAYACNTYNQATLAQHCAITYLAPARIGDRLTAHAREVTRTGRSGLYDVTVADQDGRTIAEFRGNARTIKDRLLPDDSAHKNPDKGGSE
ncbi:hydroxyphenylacetyl-CoA thioesterase PaaI [Rhodovulum sp. P5]|uniref:hydroxyphenylacetyl-CoA thioesterase PaaI n=1 Tax=Rhodovulum sp. P5 TaxID=1564506 RepID=UPI0012ECA9D1|nr:hydroxyphenylacetyl-CoA thioesterase PaaI [Rhodovulum sp. P5]